MGFLIISTTILLLYILLFDIGSQRMADGEPIKLKQIERANIVKGTVELIHLKIVVADKMWTMTTAEEQSRPVWRLVGTDGRDFVNIMAWGNENVNYLHGIVGIENIGNRFALKKFRVEKDPGRNNYGSVKFELTVGEQSVIELTETIDEEERLKDTDAYYQFLRNKMKVTQGFKPTSPWPGVMPGKKMFNLVARLIQVQRPGILDGVLKEQNARVSNALLMVESKTVSLSAYDILADFLNDTLNGKKGATLQLQDVTFKKKQAGQIINLRFQNDSRISILPSTSSTVEQQAMESGVGYSRQKQAVEEEETSSSRGKMKVADESISTMSSNVSMTSNTAAARSYLSALIDKADAAANNQLLSSVGTSSVTPAVQAEASSGTNSKRSRAVKLLKEIKVTDEEFFDIGLKILYSDRIRTVEKKGVYKKMWTLIGTDGTDFVRIKASDDSEVHWMQQQIGEHYLGKTFLLRQFRAQHVLVEINYGSVPFQLLMVGEESTLQEFTTDEMADQKALSQVGINNLFQYLRAEKSISEETFTETPLWQIRRFGQGQRFNIVATISKVSAILQVRDKLGENELVQVINIDLVQGGTTERMSAWYFWTDFLDYLLRGRQGYTVKLQDIMLIKKSVTTRTTNNFTICFSTATRAFPSSMLKGNPAV